MQEKALRTIGATAVLATLVVIGVTQASAGREEPTAEIVAVETTTTVTEESTSTTAPPPFVYRVGILSSITTDNFWAFYGEQPSVWNSYLLGPTKPALYTVDPTAGSLQPELAAESVEPQRVDGVWQARIELNPELEWSDGVPVTSHDVAFTFDTVRELDLAGAWADTFPPTVVAIHTDGDHTVVIEFSQRPQLAVWPHAVGLAPVMPSHIWEPMVEDAETPSDLYEQAGGVDVSGGPLELAETADTRLVSVANPGYVLADPPDTVEYLVYEDEPAATAALRDGDIDFVLAPHGVSVDSVAAISDLPSVQLVTSPGNGIRYLGFNLARKPMAEPAFRHALALLLDRSLLEEGSPARSLVPEANTQWFDEEAASAITRRFERPIAKRLEDALNRLETAGYEWEQAPSLEDGQLVAGSGLTVDGQPPQPLTILTPGDEYDPARPDHVETIADTLGILGFDARPVETDFDTVVDLAFTPGEDGALQYDMYMLGWTLGNPALPGYYGALFAAEGPMNNTGYRSAKFDEALDVYEGAFDMATAREALWEMERILARDLPYLLLYTGEITEAYRSDRVEFPGAQRLGGLQATLGGIWDVKPAR